MKKLPQTLSKPFAGAMVTGRLLTRPISRRASLFAVSMALLLAGQPDQATASTWTSTVSSNSTWSDNTSTGWNGTGVPNSAGAIALFSSNGTTSVDNTYTVGVIRFSGAPTSTRSINDTTATASLTLDNSGSAALIENITTGTNGLLSFGGTGAGLILNNGNLTINNTNTSALASGSISFSTGTGAALHGTGNLTITNASNNAASAQIVINAPSDFTGTTLIGKGAVTFSNSSGTGTVTPFGLASNVVTLGSAGNSATLESVTSVTLANNITVAAINAGDTRVLGSTNTSNSSISTFSGNILLNGDVSLNSVKGTGAYVDYSGVISGTGSVTAIGTGATRLSNADTYNGATTVSSGTLAVAGASGALANTPSLTVQGGGAFQLGDAANGLANRINPAANLTLGGTGGGGTFTIFRGNATTANNQSLVSLTVAAGNNAITNSGTTGANPTLTISGASPYNRNVGGIVNFTSAATGTDTVSFTNAPSGSGVVGGLLVGAVLNNGDFVAAASGSVAAPAYTAFTGTAAISGNANVTGDGTATNSGATINSLRFNTGAFTATLAGTNTIASGGVLVGSGATSGTISGGTIQAAPGSDLWVYLATGKPLTINSVIGDNSASSLSVGGGVSALTLNGVNTYTGNTTIGPSTLTIGGAGQLGAGFYSGAISGTGSLVYGSSADQILSGGITMGSGSLTKAGTSTLTVSGVPASYSGATTVNGGTLRFGINQAIPSGSFPSISAAAASGSATLDVAGFTATLNGATFGSATGGAGAINSLVLGSGANTGTVTVNNNVTYNSTTNPGPATISGAGNLVLVSTRTFTIGDSTATANELTISANITSGGISKLGLGAMTLSGANNNGGITVGAGTLAIDSAGSTTARLSSSAISVNTGGTLLLANSSATASTDRINNASVTLSGGTLASANSSQEGIAQTRTGGVLTPGASTAGLNALNLTVSSTLDFDSLSNGNLLSFASLNRTAGTLSITNWTNSNFNGTDSSGLGTDDRLVFATSQAGNLGFFDFGFGPGINVTQVSLNGSFFEVGAVPEPATWVLLGFGFAFLLWRKRSHPGKAALI